jgi:hypothetical protein
MIAVKCVRLSNLGWDTFCEYKPHIDAVTVEMYHGKWDKYLCPEKEHYTVIKISEEWQKKHYYSPEEICEILDKAIANLETTNGIG